MWADARPLNPDTISALFHKHCDAAGLPRIRLHDVRHSYATAALQAGVSPKIISERLGHATAAFTLQVYSHVIPGMDEEAATSVASLILSAGDTEPQVNGRTSGRQSGVAGQTRKPLTWRKPRLAMVAGAGFEPATSGL